MVGYLPILQHSHDAGLQMVLDRFCKTQALHLDEAVEYVADPFQCARRHPFAVSQEHNRGRKRKEEPAEKGTSPPKAYVVSQSEEKFFGRNLLKKVGELLNLVCDENKLFAKNPALKGQSHEN